MTSPLEGLQGAQQPRFLSLPADVVSSAGREAVELASMAGLHLDPWQAFVLEHSLSERVDGSWAASRVGLVVPRQNGKGSILEARELAGLFLLGERLIIHSAHQFDTSLEAFRRLLTLVEENPEFDRRVKRVSRSHGEEGIELRGGQRIRFRTRTKGGGRGFTGDCLILDEAMILPEATLAALLPTLSARPNPQVWYTGSAVDQLVHEDGTVLARVRQHGHAGDNPRLAYFEWTLDVDNPDLVSDQMASDPASWAESNPGLGIRIQEETIEAEKHDLDPRAFATERLGVGDWPALDGLGGPIDVEKWLALTDQASEPRDPVCFAIDVSPDRAWATVSAAGYRSDGLAHVETARRERGTGWVVDYVVGLNERHKHIGFLLDSIGPAGTLIHELEQRRVNVQPINSGEHALACGLLLDWVEQSRLRHLGTPELEAAIRGADKRPMLDKWAWARKSSAVDITPLVAATFAVWGLSSMNPPPKEPMVAWV